MVTENISTLKVHKLTQEQYETALENNALDKNSIYLTPTIMHDYAFKSDLEVKADLVDGKVPLSQLPDDIGGGASSWDDLEDKPTNVSEFNNDAGYLTSIPEMYVTEQDISNFVEFTDLKTVATSGKYADLDGIPSEFTPASHEHDASYYTESEIDAKFSDVNIVIAGLEDTKASIDSVNGLSQSITDLDEAAQKTANLVTAISSTSTDAEYPSAKAVYSELAGKQDTLTIESDLISGNDNPVTSGAVKDALDGVIEIASGKCKTYVFDSYEELTMHLLGDENGENQDTALLDSLKSGDVLLIRALYEPDFWWEEVRTREIVRANFEPEIIVSGYGVARVLETTKCDLTNYALSTDIPTQLSELGADENHLLVTQAEKDAWSAKSNFSGNYNDLTNKPTIPAAYTHPANHPATMITGLSTVATSGSYNDLSNKPTIPTIPSSLPANGGNADTIDGYHIRTGTSGAAGYITFVV